MEIDFKNSPKMEFWLFETKIWYAWLGLYKDAMKIMQDEKFQFFFYGMPKSLNGSN